MLFINTRPKSRASLLTASLIKSGVTVAELPLLEMIPMYIEPAQNKQNLAQAYDVLIVVSPTAAELGCDFLQKNSLTLHETIKVVAVGQSTANTLRTYGIKAVIPNIASNEGMLALSCIRKLGSHSTVMVWRGQGGRRLLIDDLKQRDISVTIIEWYSRQLPTTTTTDFQSLLQQKSVLHAINNKQVHVLISSGDAFTHWLQLLKNITAMNNSHSIDFLVPNSFHYLLLGNRLSPMLDKQNLLYIVIDSLHPEEIKTKILNEN